VFQALFMREMVGGSYTRSLTTTFMPELLSMNLLMTGMVPTMMVLQIALGGGDPTTAAFWFVMSMALLVGFVFAYPINWWLVSYHLKHGMMTVRPAMPVSPHAGMAGMESMASGHTAVPPTMDMAMDSKPRPPVLVMAVLSFLALAVSLVITTLAVPM